MPTYRSPPNLEKAAQLLWARIPTPRRPAPIPQKSWRTLSAGRVLALRQPWFDGARRWPAGSRFEVAEPTNMGISLRPLLTGPSEPSILSAMESISWSDPDWKATFELVKRPARPKKPTASQ
jgi:hypothetical protein